jgi:phage repressor protein C with HTH and peptisase S24 domain
VKQGGIYLVQPPDGGLTVKRVYVSDGSLILTSDNPDRTAFPARAVSLKSGRQLQKVLVGRVRWIGHEED